MTIPTVLQAPMGALGALGMHTSLPGKDSTSAPPRFGMTMWFKVAVTDPTGGKSDLGLWSSCQGLGVNLETEPVWSGGDNHAPYLTPKQITYPNVKLQRGMTKASAKQVRDWLETVAGRWIGGDEGGAAMASAKSGGSNTDKSPFRGSTVTVSLFSALVTGDQLGSVRGNEREVASWELRDAIPVSWTGPNLTTTAGGVAIEELALVHRGFLNPRSVSPKPTGLNSQNQGRLTLTYDGKSLEFQYNPREVTEERTNRFGSESDGKTLNLNSEELIYDRKKLSMSDLQVEGVTAVKAVCDRLWEWTEPDHGAKDSTGKPVPKQVKLMLGAGSSGLVIKEDVVIKTAKVTYKRFTPAGVPSRALVNLTLIVPEKKAGQKQPGGRPRSASR